MAEDLGQTVIYSRSISIIYGNQTLVDQSNSSFIEMDYYLCYYWIGKWKENELAELWVNICEQGPRLHRHMVWLYTMKEKCKHNLEPIAIKMSKNVRM